MIIPLNKNEDKNRMFDNIGLNLSGIKIIEVEVDQEDLEILVDTYINDEK